MKIYLLQETYEDGSLGVYSSFEKANKEKELLLKELRKKYPNEPDYFKNKYWIGEVVVDAPLA